jgi:hypothetical protein
MAKRTRMSRRSSRRNFRKGSKVKSKNFAGSPMRGGIRL